MILSMRFQVLALLLCVSCADVTEVRVRLLADETVVAAARELRVTIRGVDDEVTERNVRIGEDGSFPFEVPIVPRAGDSDRTFEFFAEVIDAMGESLGSQRVLANFTDGEQRIIERTFSASCTGVRCAAGRTCSDGECVTACFLAEGASVPAECSGNVCEERGLIAEHFEETDSWPMCPDFETESVGTCMRTNGDHVFEVVDARTDNVLLTAPPCGSRVLHLEVGESGADAAFIALPSPRGPRWVRAMFYAPASSFVVLSEQPERNQALMRWTAGTQVIGSDTAVNFRWNDSGTFVQWRTAPPLRQDGSGGLPQLPSDRWTCVEFHFDPSTQSVQVGIDGTLFQANESTIADAFVGDVFHAHVGLIGGILPTTLYVDDIVVSNERIPCP
jgi:hypothetical protein